MYIYLSCGKFLVKQIMPPNFLRLISIKIYVTNIMWYGTFIQILCDMVFMLWNRTVTFLYPQIKYLKFNEKAEISTQVYLITWT